jgi:hypothetical protein
LLPQPLCKSDQKNTFGSIGINTHSSVKTAKSNSGKRNQVGQFSLCRTELPFRNNDSF